MAVNATSITGNNCTPAGVPETSHIAEDIMPLALLVESTEPVPQAAAAEEAHQQLEMELRRRQADLAAVRAELASRTNPEEVRCNPAVI